MTEPSSHYVLEVGSGPAHNQRLPKAFATWQHLRLDLDLNASPNVVAHAHALPLSTHAVQAVFSSHTLEHLPFHHVVPALSEMRRVVDNVGFILLTLPDLDQVLRHALDHGLMHAAYQSSMGPITPLDMLYGHRGAIAAGNDFMAHRTGFNASTLRTLLAEAGFTRVLVRSDAHFNLWALAAGDAAPDDLPNWLDQHRIGL